MIFGRLIMAALLRLAMYKDFIEHLEEQPQDAGLEFWTRHLADVEPCIFPVSAESSADCAGVQAGQSSPSQQGQDT